MYENDDILSCPFKVIPINPNFSKNEILKAINKMLFSYHPDKSAKTNDMQINKRIRAKYTEISSSINQIRNELKKNNITINRFSYQNYQKKFKNNMKNYSNDELIIILKENSIDTTGNRNIHEEKILNNVPSRIAKLNLWEFNEKKQIINNILNSATDVVLIRILELKNITPAGDRFSYIKQIKHNIDEHEIEDLISQVNEEITGIRIKLENLNKTQLQKILTNHNLNSYGNKNQLITKIVENIRISEIDENIKKVSIDREKALKKLYALTGKDSISPEFKNILSNYGLNEFHGNKIKKDLISKINAFKLPYDKVESDLYNLLETKSKEVQKETINELYKIIGKNNHNSYYLNLLNEYKLSSEIGTKIKNEIISEIKNNNIKKDDLKFIISTNIKQEALKIENEKLDKLYEITGKTKLNSEFISLLNENNLEENDGLEIKEELITLIKSNDIEKNNINLKINELIKIKKIKKQLFDLKSSYLNQIAILNNLPTDYSKEKQIKIIIGNISPLFNDLTIEKNISQISDIEILLNNYYKKQIEDILIKNEISHEGVKNDLIDKCISNIPLLLINLYIDKINKFNETLNELTLPEIKYILKINDIKAKGGKDNLIKEINKKLSQNDVNINLDTIHSLNLTLNDLKLNELIYIAHNNNILISDEKTAIINEIRNKLTIPIIQDYIDKIRYIETIINSYSGTQLKHVAIVNNLELYDSKEKQINEILEKGNLSQIMDINDKIKSITKTLNSFNINQLHYILDKNNQKISLNKKEQIQIILDNLLLVVIERDIQDINETVNDLNRLNEDQIEEIIELNRINKSLTKSENISNILELIPIKTIKNNIKTVQNKNILPHENKVISIENIYNINFINPIKQKNNKKAITTVKRDNLLLLLLLDEEEYNIYINDNDSLDISKLEKSGNYFINFVKKNNNIDGIYLKTVNNNFILKKDLF